MADSLRGRFPLPDLLAEVGLARRGPEPAARRRGARPARLLGGCARRAARDRHHRVPPRGGEGPGPTCRRWSTSTTGAWWPGGAGPPLGGARDGHARGRGRGSGSASGRASPARCPGGATRPTTPPWRASSEGSRWRCSGAVTGRGGPPTPSPASWPPTSAGATPRGSRRSARAAAPYGTRQTGGGAASARRPELCKVQERVRAPK